jgi:DNA repair exonuclease SbcCD ATPase subunit
MKPRATDEQLNALNAEVTHLKELMACGHPGACIVSPPEGTSYCAACESLGGHLTDLGETKDKLVEAEKERDDARDDLRQMTAERDGFVAQVNQSHAKLAKSEQELGYLRQKADRAAADVPRSEKLLADVVAVTAERDQIRSRLALVEAQMQKKVAAPDAAVKALQEMAEGGCRCHEKPCHGGCGAFVLAANSALIRASK